MDQHRLTLVTGLPGAGKTVLLTGWAKDRPLGTTAWMGLEGHDNDPSHFWRHMAAGVRCVDPALGSDLLDVPDGLVAASAPDPELLLHDVMAMPPAVLIVDDFQAINSPKIVEAVHRFIGALPAHVHLVLASRQEPGFPLHRMRMSGELLEIRDRDLRFTVEEAGALFARVVDRPAAPDDIRAFVDRTEGWAAGLRLAALAWANDTDPSDLAQRFSGEFDVVAEYLDQEVLAGQPPDLIRFLLETSVLEQMTGELCSEVTGRTDADRILADLASRNLFAVKLDSRHEWYRYHRLFVDLLRHRLRHQDPTIASQAHLRAAAWFEGRGDAGAAIQHLVEAGRYDQAFTFGASTVVEHLDDGLPPGAPLLPAGLPEEYFEQDPYRMYALAAALLSALRTADAASRLDRLDRLIEKHPDRTMLEGRIEFLRALHDGLVGDGAGLLNHSRRASELLGLTDPSWLELPTSVRIAHPWLPAIDATIPRQLAILGAHAQLWLDEPADAHASLATHFRDADHSRDVAHLGMLALIACREGHLRQAHATSRAALEEAGRQNHAGSLVTLDARIALGVVLWENDDLDAAQKQLDHALRVCESMGCAHGASEVRHHLIRVMISQGRLTEALDRVSHVRRAELQNPLPEHLQHSLDDVEIRCRLALGDLQGAALILKSVPFERRAAEVLARVDLCAGRPDRAAARLTAAPTQPISLGVEVERLALLARAQLQLGNRRQADDALRRAIERSRPERYISRLVEQATELLPLLYEVAGRFPDMYVAELLAHAKRTGATAVQTTPVPTLEPLTDREREILGHLTGHLTQHEIAGGMYVSVNTLKTHINRVYRKLGAGSRSEAVAVARAHGLL
ncbi:MAG TPA: LuxR C-terminal-related transcriptional regulator [Acidimicrobiales bacterium]|nr:LuxR C-terminal-related transcriptional regulator [Acidimicrobiales bacterium]